MGLKETLIETHMEIMATSDTEELARLQLQLGLVEFQIAEGLYHDGEDLTHVREAIDSSAQAYADAIDYLLDCDRDQWVEFPQIIISGLKMALCAHDRHIQHRIANEALRLPERYVDERLDWGLTFYSMRAYASVVIEHPAAEKYYERTQERIESQDRPDRVIEPGLWWALGGILDDDRDTIQHGIDVAIEDLAGRYEKGEAGIFFDVLGMTILARQHGYDLTPDSPVVPEELLVPPETDYHQ